MTCQVNGHRFTGLLDSGADVSIIKDSEWPLDWPTVCPAATIHGPGFSIGAIGQPSQALIKLVWKSDQLVWVDQWPMKKEWLEHLKRLVKEQLEAGDIVPTNSPWNTPVFCIPKKTGKWRMLQDLRAVHAVIESMGALQPGLPSPTMLPANWSLIIIDLKDCFLTIFLYPKDAPRFAFSIPALNNSPPMQRYHWVVLPQGMKNSPTICQTVVANAIHPIRKHFPSAIIYQYMDDILISMATEHGLQIVVTSLTDAVQEARLQVASEKIQRSQTWSYLGWRITQKEISPQPLQLKVKDTLTLHELQKLLGAINWLRPILGLIREELLPLFVLLKRDSDLMSDRSLTAEAKQALDIWAKAIENRQGRRRDPELQICLALVPSRKFDFYIMHIRSHTDMPGPIAAGNREADKAAMFNIVPRTLEQAKLSHSFFHQNARSLKRQFKITINQARDIILTCPDCQKITPMPSQEGVNPRGLMANEIWETDVTYIPKFGTLKYVHVTVDTHSQYITATAHTGEKAKDVIRHWLSCFATLGTPKQIKTDNGPAYVSEKAVGHLREGQSSVSDSPAQGCDQQGLGDPLCLRAWAHSSNGASLWAAASLVVSAGWDSSWHSWALFVASS
ncbi:PREDICTED: endogenous retrovirus group K member 8 Pol protein-like [Lepidothrix coronata]|uniref:Endogenous retrovirus group K member 8 Pol protein-like n=1 Tax=Lepidothrix coronata TaxID=321398 RepID=A0A6J0IEQ7_9PASS|nr:PREDICTED: endogenous retrovirus group K member 8 Pol protein-like [Lepidothrix coronata]